MTTTTFDNAGIRVTRITQCDLCGSAGQASDTNLRDALFSNARGSWSLFACPSCGLVWLNPRPLPEAIPKLYSSYYTHEQAAESTSETGNQSASTRSGVKNGILYKAFGYEKVSDGGLGFQAGKIISRIGLLRDVVGGQVRWLRGEKKGRLLDLGCGNGTFLVLMKSLGWDVVGIEPDPQAVHVAREQRGLVVHEGSLDTVRLPEKSFDAITLNHVIEHLTNPAQTLSVCRSLLREGGRLVVVTPNITGMGRRIFGSSWGGLETPRHLFLFSRSTLRRCAEKAGLKVLDITTTTKLAHRMWYYSRLIQRHGKLSGGVANVVPPLLSLECYAFWIVEQLLLNWDPDIGEEVVLVATRDR